MPTVCSAYGCTYRHRKGDNIGMYSFPKNDNLRRLWTVAVRRSNWDPTPTSRICGKHFQSGRPSKDVNHPDYVPNLFVFNRNEHTKEHWQKVAEEKASERVAEFLYGAPKVEMTGYRQLKPKLEGYGVPFVIKARKADGHQPINPSVSSCHFSTMMKKNMRDRKAVQTFNSRGRFIIPKEIKPSETQRVWVLNFDEGKKNSNESVEKPGEMKSKTAPVTSLRKIAPKIIPASVSDSSIMIYEDGEPVCVESSMTISDDDSTLTAESSIPDIYDTEPFMEANKNIACVDVDAIEDVSDDALDDKSSAVVDSLAEDSTDSDYSEFKSNPFDTKDILAIKLETMLAVNISLKHKVEFYQNRCKQQEKEISNLRDTIKKTKTGAFRLS